MNTPLLYKKSTIYFLVAIFFIFQFYIIFNLEIYPETHTVVKWYQSKLGIFDTLGMRIMDDGTFKATYSFIYLLPVYTIFIFFKFFTFSDHLSLALSNFVSINSQLFLILYISRKMFDNAYRAFLFYFLFFIGTFMWTGLQRTFPHDSIILLILIQHIFPRLRPLFMTLIVYVDPVIGSFFVFIFHFLSKYSNERNNLLNFFIAIKASALIILFGLFLWQIPIIYLQSMSEISGNTSSIYERILGRNDPHFYTRLQIFTPFHYYLPLYIQSSFSSFKFGALPFAASNIITPVGLYILYNYRSTISEFYNKKNLLLVSGFSLMISYLIFSLIFGQAAASHRFDYDQYFQAGLLFVLIFLSHYQDILKDRIIIVTVFYYFIIILPYLLVQFIFLRP